MNNKLYLLAVVLAVGTIVFVQQNATSNQTNSTYGAANCDSAAEERNSADNWAGNSKKCNVFEEDDGSESPVRSCHSPNEFKDNNEDGFASCKFRGNDS